MLCSPYVNAFKGKITNLTGRPSATWGTSITPGNNSFPAYAEILGDTAFACYLIEVVIFANNVATVGRDTLVTLGFDFAGGTTYTDMEILHLIGSTAGPLASGGTRYVFPVFIPEGTAIAAKASVDNATVGTLRVGVRLYGRPTHPELIRAGRYVTSWGAVTASSKGTDVTSGTTSEGAWTEMTAADTVRSHWFFQIGFASDDTSLTSGNIYAVDLSVGDASNKELVFEDHLIRLPTAAEDLNNSRLAMPAYYGECGAGARVFVRSQCSGTADSNVSMMAYGVGG